MTIWKYELQFNQGVQSIEMPEESKVLCFQMQNNVPAIWCLVNDFSNKLIHKRFIIFGTGWYFQVPDGKELKHIGTIQDNGGFVWHLFEEQELVDSHNKF